MSTMTMKARELPVVREVDVMVAGGGFAGFGAAMCAARNGARTLLVEQQSAIGGLVTLGYVALTFSYIEGVGYEFFHIMQQAGGVKGRFLDLEKAKVVMETMLLRAGVEILYNTSIVDAEVVDGKLTGAVIFNKGGLQAVRAKRFVDATGDGDLAVYAGVPYEAGCPDLDNYNQATSLVMHVGNVAIAKFRAVGNPQARWIETLKTALDNGEYPYMIDKRPNWLVEVPGRDPEHAELYI